MASGETGVYTRCPACNEPIELNATVRLDMKRVVLGSASTPPPSTSTSPPTTPH